MYKKTLFILLLPVTILAQPPIDSLVSVVNEQFNGAAAYNHVRFISQFWRVAGGKDFNTCVDYIAHALDSIGLSSFNSGTASKSMFGHYYVQEDSLDHLVWNPKNAQLSIISPAETTLQTYTSTPVMLCQNSFPIDTIAELIYVGKGDSEDDYTNKNVQGKIVFGDAGVKTLIHFALLHGALGVVSSMVRPFNHPEIFPGIISEEGISYNDAIHSFGLKVSARSAGYLKSLLSTGRVTAHISVSTSFTSGKLRTLVAEIPGREKSGERVVFVAHLDHYKPGANDNASGSATLAEMVSTFVSLLKQRKIAQPARTLAFFWVDERNGTYAWIKAHPEETKNTVAVFNLDMTGEDASKTGGQFWMERVPDPASVWLRPPDKHTEWGAPTLTEDRLLPTWLNDFYFSILQEQAARSNWKIGQHPFEGGSDNEPFLQAGIPAVTNWHFTDYFYHSSMDDADKVSPTEMKNVGTATLVAGYAIASPSEKTFQYALSSLRSTAKWRLENEAANSKAAIDSVGRSQHEYFLQRQKEKIILDAWTKWYDEAFLSLKSFSITSSLSDDKSIAEERQSLQSLRKKIGERIGIE
jgi:aminopeptidase YwaD